MLDQKRLQPFIEELKKHLDNELLSVLLYGSALLPDRKTDTANLLMVFKSIDADTLTKLESVMREHSQTLDIEPFVMTTNELERSADILPIKLLNISRHHQCLLGNDPFENLKIDREHLRLRCEQELTSMVLRLRYSWIMHAGFLSEVSATVKRLVPLLFNNLDVLVELKTGQVYDSRRTGFDTAITTFNISDQAILADIAAWQAGDLEQNQEQFTAFYNRFSALVNHLAVIADQL